MDGLSAAASGIAVVSLAIQLVDSVREIQRFLRSIADAPEELERLIELLEQLELILETIGKLVENQRTQHGDLDIDVSPSIMKAVQTCEKTLKRLEVLIAKAKNNSGSKNPATKYLGRFRLACKKEDIEEFEMQLHRAISNLNLIMTANLTASHSQGMEKLLTKFSSTNAATSAITQELVLLRMDVTNSKEISKHGSRPRIPSRYSTSASYRRATCHRVIYQGVLGSITTTAYSESEGFSQEEGSTDVETRENRSWYIIPSFLSRCVQIQYASSFGFVERTLRTYPLIRDDHRVWKLCEEGDVTALQQIISNREISPYSVDK